MELGAMRFRRRIRRERDICSNCNEGRKEGRKEEECGRRDRERLSIYCSERGKNATSATREVESLKELEEERKEGRVDGVAMNRTHHHRNRYRSKSE